LYYSGDTGRYTPDVFKPTNDETNNPF